MRISAVWVLISALCCAATSVLHASELAGITQMRTLAKQLMHDGEYGEAINTYQAIADAAFDDARAHYDLAAAMTFIQMYIDAQAPLARARQLQPAQPRYHALAALLHMQLGQDQGAFEASLLGAKLGDSRAMFVLVGMYMGGRGVTRDADLARSWLVRAAEAGHLGALDMLVRLHRDGTTGEGGLQAPVDKRLSSQWQTRMDKAEAALDQG